MLARLPQSHAIRTLAPPPALAAHISAFVHRDEWVAGGTVRMLPDLRASIQVMRGTPYFVKSRGSDASWRQLPRLTLWGPRQHWAYGYARGQLDVFGIGLTAAGLAALAIRPACDLLEDIVPLHAIDPALAPALDPALGEGFEAWCARIIAPLSRAFAETAPPERDLAILATAEGDAVARAANAAGLSLRQYRRVFRHRHGVTPKAYQRVARVDRLIRQLHDHPWETDRYRDLPIAFADQAHAIREFRALTGLTPRGYVRLKRNGDATLRSVPADTVEPPQP